jgi:hypothetical protein
MASLLAASGIACGVFLSGCASHECKNCGEEHEHEHDHHHAHLRAKVSKADAQRAALERVPDGTVKEAELEKEKGQVIWSFDIATPGTSDITEVHVDAETGQVIAMDKESAEDEAHEAKQEMKHKHHQKEDDEKEDNQ